MGPGEDPDVLCTERAPSCSFLRMVPSSRPEAAFLQVQGLPVCLTERGRSAHRHVASSPGNGLRPRVTAPRLRREVSPLGSRRLCGCREGPHQGGAYRPHSKFLQTSRGKPGIRPPPDSVPSPAHKTSAALRCPPGVMGRTRADKSGSSGSNEPPWGLPTGTAQGLGSDPPDPRHLYHGREVGPTTIQERCGCCCSFSCVRTAGATFTQATAPLCLLVLHSKSERFRAPRVEAQPQIQAWAALGAWSSGGDSAPSPGSLLSRGPSPAAPKGEV